MPRVVLAFVSAFVLLAPSAARAGDPLPPVGLLEILYFEDAGGWRIESHLEGSDAVTTATLTPPGQPAIALACAAVGPTSTECELLDPALDQPGYESLAAILVPYPAGDWVLTIDGTLISVLSVLPVSPDGVVEVTSPLNGAEASSTPTVEYTHDCTNCVALYFEIDDLAGLELESFVGGAPPASPGSIAYAAFLPVDTQKPDELPNGEYRLTAGAAVGYQVIEQLSDASTFQYTMAVAREGATTFRVPEPLAPGLAALGALIGLARRRRLA